MNYVISDIHGCYKEFKTLLKNIGFSSADTLFVLGDMVDRGPDPIGSTEIDGFLSEHLSTCRKS